MINSFLTSEINNLVHRSMDSAALQHKLIANNLANVDTLDLNVRKYVFRIS